MLNKKVKNFLDDVCIHINCKAVHKDIREELNEHIYLLKEEYENDGYGEEESLDLAIKVMGNTDVIGEELNNHHKPRTEWSILILTALLSSFGALIMFLGDRSAENFAFGFSRYIIYLVLGIISMIGFYHFDYTKLKKMWNISYLSGIFLVLITLFAGVTVNGARRWLFFGGFSISIPEFASLLFLIGFAGLLEKYRGWSFFNVLKLGAYGLSSTFLIIMMPNLALAFILIGTYSIMVLVAVLRNHFKGNKKIQLFILIGSGFTALIGLLMNILSSPYKRNRFFSFLSRNNSNDSGGSYFHHMADVWLSLSKWFGKTEDTYEGYSIHNTLPNTFDEYILINIIATLGWIIGILLVIFVAIFILRLILMTWKVKNSYGFYLSLSVCTMLSLQFIINILMNFNLFPLMSINMPFVSYDGTGYIVNMIIVGIILSIWRRDNLISYREEKFDRKTKKRFINYLDGKIIIDLKGWKA